MSSSISDSIQARSRSPRQNTASTRFWRAIVAGSSSGRLSASASTRMASVLVRVDDVRAGHGDPDRREAMQHADRVAVLGQDLVEPLVGIGRLVGGTAAELDPPGREVGTDRVVVDQAGPALLALGLRA